MPDIAAQERESQLREMERTVMEKVSMTHSATHTWPLTFRGKWMLYIDFAKTNHVANFLDGLVLA